MPSHDFVPISAPLFDLWQKNLVTRVNLYKSGWNLSPDTLTEWNKLTATPGIKKLRWEAAWAIISTRNFKHSDEQEMKDARKDYESGVRNNSSDTSLRIFVNRYIRNNPLVTDEQKKECGLTVPHTTATPTTPTNARLDAELVGTVVSMRHLQHFLSVKEPGRDTKARDKGISEIAVFIAFTEFSVKTPPSLNSFAYDGDVKRGLYHREFTTEQQGLYAWYIVRKKLGGRSKAYGPPSEAFGALIP